jgi:hypothetical protein
MSHGKGFAFLQMVDKDARRPVSYATQRFASSAYEQWQKIEKSYSSLWKAFDLLHPQRNDDKEWQYMIAGSDFVADLLAFLDIMEPVVDLMIRAQALDTPMWKLKLWWPKVKAKLMKAGGRDMEAFPRLQKAQDTLKPGETFRGVELLQGWLIVQDDGVNAGENRFKWSMREEDEIKEDRERFARDLAEALDKRVSTVVNPAVVSHLEVEEYGVESCKRVLKVASEMSHIQSAGINFDHRMAHTYMSRIKKAVKQGIWNGTCPEWFESQEASMPQTKEGADLVGFHSVDTTELDSVFTMLFANGNVHRVRLNEHRFYESFYSRKEIYEVAEPAACALLDIVLAKGGPETIAESFYNAMRSQQQSGGQLNETLAR